MVDVNIYFFWWVSTTVNPLKSMMPGTSIAALSMQLSMARQSLQMLNDAMAGAIPRTTERMKELLTVIDGMLPSDPSHLLMGLDRRTLSVAEAGHLQHSVKAIELTLEEEARHSYIVCLQNQRCLSAYSLVERIDSCFADFAWNIITDAAKREFQEAGRCLALERYTGAGFHSLRGVECVIRQFIGDLTASQPAKRDWGFYIEILKKNDAAEGLLMVLNDIRTGERNPLMHPEDWLEIDDAIAIFTISQSAVSRLASDMHRKFPDRYPRERVQ